MDNLVETVGKKKLGIGLVKWMGEDKDVYERKRREGCDILQQMLKSSLLCICLPCP